MTNPIVNRQSKIANQIVQWGVLALLALMPLHAFLSVWLGSLTGEQTLIQAWKEILMTLLLVPGAFLLWQKRAIVKQPLFVAIAAFVGVALLISFIFEPLLMPFLFGVKTDILFLIVFVVAWLTGNREFKHRAAKVLIASSGVVIAFGLLQILALPRDFLTQFGYGINTLVPYQLVAGDGDSVRILSTLGGPNQLGSFLILPLCLVLALFIKKPRWWHPLFLIGGLVVEWHTYSRSAWIGLAIAALITLIITLPARRRLWAIGVSSLLGLVAIGGIALNFDHPTVQRYVLHGSTENLDDSTDRHADALQAGLTYINDHPLGTGLGSAGPASFQGDKPFVPESYYLQLAAEVGVIGLLLFIGICFLLGQKLWADKESQVSAAPVLAALVGISIVNLFLHGWADSSTALTYWAYAGIVVGSKT